MTEDAFGNMVVERTEKQKIESEGAGTEITVSEGLLDQAQESSSDLRSASDSTSVELDNSSLDGNSPESVVPQGEERKLSIFEQKYIESEVNARKALLEKLKRNPRSSDIDVTEIDEDAFVDGDLLLQQGGLINKNKSPYYITVEADGTIRTTAYDPLLEKQFVESQRNKKFQFTDATVYRASQEPSPPIGEVDAKAAELFSLSVEGQRSYFEEFGTLCCRQLPELRNLVLDPEEEPSLSLSLNEDDLSYRFHDGDSRYLLVEIPVREENYPLRLRSFVRSFKSKNISHGVFFPQLVTLDKDKNPIRIISNPILKYTPETWTHYGFLEGVFDMEQNHDYRERYILITTTRQALKERSVIDEGNKSIELRHMPIGSFELKLIE